VILLYLESFGNPRRFLEIARRVGRTKPIVAVKSGRTRAGIRAASSHTGSLAGADTAVSALCSQAGVIRTDTMEELFDVAMLIANQPVPHGTGVGIVTNAGGPGIMASDACESHGLEVATLSESTLAELRKFLPPEASVRNPVDMIASATPASYEKAVRLIANDPNVHAVLAIYVTPIVTQPLEVAEAIVRGSVAAAADAAARGQTPRTMLSCFLGSHGVPEGLRSLQTGHIPSYAFPESAAIALARAVRYGRWRDEPEGREVQLEDVDAPRVAKILASIPEATANAPATAASWLGVDETRELLASYGIRMPAVELARDAAEAVRAAQRVGFPVAIKLASDTITHKSDVGGVVLDVRTAEEVKTAFAGIASRLADAGHAASAMTGVTIQPMLREGIEMIVGMARDPAFGALVVLGLGGIEVELLKDVVFRVAPLTDRDAREMVRGLRSSALLAGYRGRPPGDVAALEETLLRFSQLVTDHPRIAEVDLNPLRVLAPGRGCLALDARISVSG
jgi:acyl-CoA synthetase (NDP forming)